LKEREWIPCGHSLYACLGLSKRPLTRLSGVTPPIGRQLPEEDYR
jgi:hypothetical protein